MRYRIVLALAAVFVVVLTVVWRAPAAWIGDWLQSKGRLRLVDARGTIWNGSALLGVSDGRQVMLVPGRVSWNVGLAGLGAGRLTAQVTHPSLPVPLAVSLGPGSIALKAGQAELPAALLVALGTPFNTVRPGGALGLRWTDVEVISGGLGGSLQIEWRDAQSALSTVALCPNDRLSKLQALACCGSTRASGTIGTKRSAGTNGTAGDSAVVDGGWRAGSLVLERLFSPTKSSVSLTSLR